METDLQIPFSATVRNARDLQQQCLDALGGEGGINIDVAAVTDADLSFVQLIQALRMTAAEAGR
ncbi:STAS domain-containing protein, partial [Sphingomonas elodea]|uniref:STAS domain-containing protein n=1 Tax=Sphingomonas elodea TaxID=179878 RepID=UPI00026303E3